MAHDTFRIKLPIQDLVKQILDALPDHIWSNPCATFLDPAMAGGQFILEIERRLKAAGHSNENIASRVWGCEQSLIRVKYVQNWHKAISTQLYVRDALAYDWGDMKFDVIVGNPPYQSPNKGDSSLWARFVLKSCQMLQPDGWNAMVIPCGWMSPTNDIRQGRQSILRDVFANQNTTLINVNPHLGPTYFPGVGQRFSYYVTQNCSPAGVTKIQTGTQDLDVNLQTLPMLPLQLNALSMSILAKISNSPTKWDFLRVNKCDYSQVVFDNATKTHKYSRLNGNTNHLDKIVFSKDPCEYQNVRKVVLPYNGTQYKFVVDNGKVGVTNCYLMVLGKKDLITSAKTYFESPLMSWLGKNKFTQYNEAALIECVGTMDLTKKICLQDIWNHYNLSQEEIDYLLNHG